MNKIILLTIFSFCFLQSTMQIHTEGLFHPNYWDQQEAERQAQFQAEEDNQLSQKELEERIREIDEEYERAEAIARYLESKI